MDRIKTILLSGFLGAGKTTLLNYVLNHDIFRQRKVAVLVNEFGKLPVDGALLPKGDYFVAEINKGSIFCVCVKTDLIKALERIAREIQPDVLLIEATGLAEPTDFSALLQTEFLTQQYEKSTIVTVVDAVNYPKLSGILPALKAQIKIADIILINKCDQAEPELVRSTECGLKLMNPGAAFYRTEFCRFPLPDDFLEHQVSDTCGMLHGCGCLAGAPPLQAVNFELRSDSVFDKIAFYDVMDKFRNNILRGKGIVDFGDNRRFVEVVNGVIAARDAAGIEFACETRSGMSFVLRNITAEDFAAECESFKVFCS